MAVKRMRNRFGKTQEEFAEMVGCRANTVSRWERGEITPSGLALIRLIDMADAEERDCLKRWLLRDGTWREMPGGGAWTRTISARGAFRKLKHRDAHTPAAEILSLWERYKGNRKAIQYFVDAASFLRVQLAKMEADAESQRSPNKGTSLPPAT